LKAYFEKWIGDNYTPEEVQTIKDAIDWEEWVKQGGKNPDKAKLNFTTSGAVQFETLADEYIILNGSSSPDNFNIYIQATDPQLRVIFLNRLL
jgi:hypothetical protein